MNKVTLWLVTTFLVGAVAIADAQQPKNIPRIGYLSGNSPSSESARTDAFWQGLRGLGYAEGKNIVTEYRWAEGKLARSPRSRLN
jgi:putative ABC transport system substrate-binding protein